MRGLPDLKTKAKVDVYGMGIPVRIDLSFFYFIGVKMKSFLTKGILNDMAVIINKNYELPLNLEIEHSPKEINIELQHSIEIEIEPLGAGG